MSMRLWLVWLAAAAAAGGSAIVPARGPLTLRWGPFTYPAGTAASAELAEPPAGRGGPGGYEGGEGRPWLHLESRGDGIAGANSEPLEALAGRVTFAYRADRASASGDNLTVYVVPLDAGGKEISGIGRASYTVPEAFVGDGRVHEGIVEYNFLGTRAAHAILGPRINEGGRGPGELWVGPVRWTHLSYRLMAESFGPEHPLIGIGRPFRVRAILRNVGGSGVSLAGLRLDAGAAKASALRPLPRTLEGMQVAEMAWEVTSATPGLLPLRLFLAGPKVLTLGESDAFVGGASRPQARVGRRAIQVEFLAAQGGVAAARVYGRAPRRSLLAVAFPLASMTLEDGERIDLSARPPNPTDRAYRTRQHGGRGSPWKDDQTARRTGMSPASRAGMSLDQNGRMTDGARFTLTSSWRHGGREGVVNVETTLRADRDLRLLRFAGPALRAGEGSFGDRKAWAHFPGLEYLVGSQRSSDNEGDPERLRLRFLPHPLKVTQRWMAVGDGDEAVGLAWDGIEQPVFASPNFLEGQRSHLMALSLPCVGDGLPENTRSLLAEKPLLLPKGRVLRLRARIFVAPARSAADGAALGWKIWVPPPVHLSAAQREDAARLSLDAFVHQLWVPEAGGWRPHLPLSLTELSRPIPALEIAQNMLVAARRLPAGDPLRNDAEAQARAVIGKAASGTGPLGLDVVEAARAAGMAWRPLLPCVRAALAGILDSQGPDGAWRFHPDAAHAALGREGETAVGLIAGNAAVLLRYAEVSGDPEVGRAGLKAVRFMESLPRPEGSQVWEVPLHVPDILAAAHAVSAYLAAYRLTKDPHWRDRAIDAGRSGLTFVYNWAAAGHTIMRYGTIPVYGTSWHSLAWFGLLVQWNGLAFAAALPPLARVDSTLPWRSIAEGITACALQLQRPHGASMYGTYPDVWSVLANGEPFTVPYICPVLILEALNALEPAYEGQV